MERKAAQLGQSRRYARASSHSLLHAPTGSITLDRDSFVATAAVATAAAATEPPVAPESLHQSVGQQVLADLSVFEAQASGSGPVDVAVRVTARSGSLHPSRTSTMNRRSTIHKSSSELPAPVTDFQKVIDHNRGSSVQGRKPADGKHKPKHSARRAGMQPFWEYLFISTLSLQADCCLVLRHRCSSYPSPKMLQQPPGSCKKLRFIVDCVCVTARQGLGAASAMRDPQIQVYDVDVLSFHNLAGLLKRLSRFCGCAFESH